MTDSDSNLLLWYPTEVSEFWKADNAAVARCVTQIIVVLVFSDPYIGLIFVNPIDSCV